MPFPSMDQCDAGKTSSLVKEIHMISEENNGCRKLKTSPAKHAISSTEDAQHHQYADSAISCEIDPLAVTKENETQCIKNLLPDEDDLFSGIIDKLSSTHLHGSEDEEDLDLFQSGGGMELELDNCLNTREHNGSNSNISFPRTHSYDEQTSRTLIVRNINSSFEDSELRTLLEQYGNIKSLYTVCKHQGFVIVSYYDIRAAWSARNSLHSKPLRHVILDVHYLMPEDDSSVKDMKVGALMVFNLDPSISSDDIYQIFGSFGEIKEIGETLQCNKFIEYYDIRAAESAYRSLNWRNIAGKQIKLEMSHDRQYLMQQFLPLLAQDECLRRGSFEDNSSLERLGTVRPSSMTNSCIYNGSINDLHSKSEMTIGAFNDNSFSQGSFSVPSSFPARVATGCNLFGLHDPRHSLEQENFSNPGPPSHHLHSGPEYYDGSPNVISYNPFGTVPDLSIDTHPRIFEGMTDRSIYIVDPKGQQVEPHVGSFGSSWTSGWAGEHYVKSNSNSVQHFPSSPLDWSNSLPLANSIHARCTPKLPGLSRASSHVLNTVSRTHGMMNKVSHDMLQTVSHTPLCHNGSVPATNTFHWNNGHAYMESIGRLAFHNKSSDLAPNYLHDGNHIGKFFNSALGSPQCSSDFLPGVNLVASAPTSFCAPKERMRHQSNCRSESDSGSADKIKYELDIDRVLRGEDNRTTLMLKNIPNKYTSKMLLATIDEQHRGTYDFIYLPIDFKNKCNMGYAFINMIDPLQIVPFYKTFNGKKWEKFNSGKVASIAYARIQGKAALVAHFQNSSLMNEDKRCRPILFCTEGPNAGDQEPFPLGSSIRSRSNKPRNGFYDENHNQGSPSSFVRGDVSSSRTTSVASSVKDSLFD